MLAASVCWGTKKHGECQLPKKALNSSSLAGSVCRYGWVLVVHRASRVAVFPSGAGSVMRLCL